MSYGNISDALVFSEKRPRRALFSFFIRSYSVMVGISVSLIMAISALSIAPAWTVLWITLYWIYLGIKTLMRRRHILGLPYRSKWIQFGRSVMLVVFASIFLGYLYGYTDYLQQVEGRDTLWLLFLLAIFIMSQYGITELMLVTILLAWAALASITLWASPIWSWMLLASLMVKGLWLAVLSLVLHILIRFIGDWYANARLLHEMEEQIMRIRSISEEESLLKSVVRHIAADFGYPHVNIFYLQPNGALRCVAGACPSGRLLAMQGYSLENGKGIIGRVIETQEPYLANDVDHDPYYYPHPSFPKTKAELAVPVKLRGEVVGILDAQTSQKSFFFPQDVEVMEIMAAHFSIVLDNLRLLKSRQRISEIVGSIAHRFLSQHELQSTLDQIVWAAHTDLEADVVTLYERDPLTGKVSGSACAGDLLHPEIFNATVAESDNLVKRLLVATDNCYFHEDVQSLSEDSIFRQSDRHARSGAPTFAEREKIESRAIIRLQTGSDRVGLMFLNFRSHRSFDDQEREPFFTFAHLAALAIQKAQFHQQQIQFERENLARQLHDQLMANADAVCRLVSLALRDMSTSDPHHSTLMLTKEAIKELKRDVKYLNETLKDTSLENLPDEVAKMTGRVKKAYDVAFEIRWTGNGYRVPTAVAVQLKLILNEAIINAIKHGDATKIKLSFEVFDSYLDISIEDNGSGFDTTRVRPSGLANMQERAERMSGYCRVESHLGTGTHVSIHVPYTTLKGDNRGATREL